MRRDGRYLLSLAVAAVVVFGGAELLITIGHRYDGDDAFIWGAISGGGYVALVRWALPLLKAWGTREAL